jgi:hypothetical protein
VAVRDAAARVGEHLVAVVRQGVGPARGPVGAALGPAAVALRRIAVAATSARVAAQTHLLEDPLSLSSVFLGPYR